MEPRAKAGIRATLLGMAVSGLLATVKLVAGIIGHSHALVADAVESFSDLFSSAIVWGGLTLSAKPPDDDHPYGHGKAESLAALAVGLMLIGAAIGIAVQAIREILVPQRAPALMTFFVLIGVVIVKELLFRFSNRVAAGIDSLALRADAWHHRSDAITSLIAAIGISISLIGGEGYESADVWAALLASGVIAFNGSRFLHQATLELMDTRPDPQLISNISLAATSVAGVRTVEKVLVRKVGMNYWVDMHIEVDGELTVYEGHELAHRAKDAIQNKHPNVADVTIHVEPARN